jgi:SAM-dependent methyltransferase
MCGPKPLQSLGANVFGLDISPAMVEQARQLNPGIRFQVGDMLALDLPDGTLAAIVAFYSIVNIPKHSLHSVFQEIFGCCASQRMRKRNRCLDCKGIVRQTSEAISSTANPWTKRWTQTKRASDAPCANFAVPRSAQSTVPLPGQTEPIQQQGARCGNRAHIFYVVFLGRALLGQIRGHEWKQLLERIPQRILRLPFNKGVADRLGGDHCATRSRSRVGASNIQ